ncbi:MAG: hypothetical protein ACI8RD_004977, partial [Bacillariaceae sp.]
PKSHFFLFFSDFHFHEDSSNMSKSENDMTQFDNNVQNIIPVESRADRRQ